MMSALYDRIGRSYVATRAEDPRIAAAIHAALGDARTVLNVGAGAGAYEPRDREVTAVEPSAVMRAQRAPDAAPCIDARAEALPFADGAFDAAMAVFSDHHWGDRLAGLRELRRVGRRAVVFQWDPDYAERFWLIRDYFASPSGSSPAFGLTSFGRGLEGSFAEVRTAVGATREVPVPIPHDCRDGFLMAYWRRPEAYLDPTVRANISVFALLPADEVDAMVSALRADLDSGAWQRRNADLLERAEYDFGCRLLIAE
ncbi:MAG TPA: class I SAM-dependent methyltransferase [Solirubrobacteraceae bacterium]|nr:class I SAM-dependent methyltransferase [Solirubrobacteraceae bacterium]